MKKIVLALFILAALALSHKAEAQRIGFYFYPDLNIYFNPQTHQYAYPDHGNWIYRAGPPPGVVVRGHNHVIVYGNRPEIWMDNDAHRARYKNWHRRHRHHY